MIGLLRDGVKKIEYCDKRPYSETQKRFWSLAVRCTCKSRKCKCDKREPHYEHTAKECALREARKIVREGVLCVECGG